MKFCPNCGTQLVSGDLFCQQCGTRLDTFDSQQQVVEQENVIVSQNTQPQVEESVPFIQQPIYQTTPSFQLEEIQLD